MTENRPQNATQNATRGTSPNDSHPRVTGNFVGTTDEIIQWAACKWGLNVDWARAQAAIESWWDQNAIGDNGESYGLLQTRRPYMQDAFEDENAVRSTAYNVDIAWALWRTCFDGQGGGPDYFWLNTVERGRDYAYGDGLGCMGTWFSGRWYTDAAVGYMGRVTDYFNQRIWMTASFGPATPTGGTPSSTSTTQPSSTSSSTAPTTAPPTVPPTTTTASSTSTTTPPTTTSTTLPPSGQRAWQDITPPNLSTDPNNPHDNYGINSIAIDPNNPRIIYVGTNYQGLWKSTNGGDSWFKVNTGTGGGMLDSGRQWALAVDPFNSNIIWTTAGYGVGGPLRSTDGGVSWVKLPAGPPTQNDDVHSITMDPYLQGHMVITWHSPWTTGAAGFTETFNSNAPVCATCPGPTWNNRPPGGPWASGAGIWFLNNSQTMLVATESAGIWRTTNGGSTWTQASSGSTSHGGDNALLNVGGTLYMAQGTTITQSTDNGQTWNPIGSGLPGNYYASVGTDGTYLYTAPYFPTLPSYIDGPWFRRPLSGGSWTTMPPNTCHTYNGVRSCNGMSDTDHNGTTVYSVNGTGGIWRLS